MCSRIILYGRRFVSIIALRIKHVSSETERNYTFMSRVSIPLRNCFRRDGKWVTEKSAGLSGTRTSAIYQNDRTAFSSVRSETSTAQ